METLPTYGDKRTQVRSLRLSPPLPETHSRGGGATFLLSKASLEKSLYEARSSCLSSAKERRGPAGENAGQGTDAGLMGNPRQEGQGPVWKAVASCRREGGTQASRRGESSRMAHASSTWRFRGSPQPPPAPGFPFQGGGGSRLLQPLRACILQTLSQNT